MQTKLQKSEKDLTSLVLAVYVIWRLRAGDIDHGLDIPKHSVQVPSYGIAAALIERMSWRWRKFCFFFDREERGDQVEEGWGKRRGKLGGREGLV
jgi:hypothetical protein